MVSHKILRGKKKLQNTTNCLYFVCIQISAFSVLNRKWETQQRARRPGPPMPGSAVHTGSSSVPAEPPGGSGTKTSVCAGSRFLWFQLSDSIPGLRGWQGAPTGACSPCPLSESPVITGKGPSRGALCAHEHLHEASCRSNQRDPEGWLVSVTLGTALSTLRRHGPKTHWLRVTAEWQAQDPKLISQAGGKR